MFRQRERVEVLVEAPAHDGLVDTIVLGNVLGIRLVTRQLCK